MKTVFIFIFFFANIIVAQKAVLSLFLRECYSDVTLVNRNNLPPMSLPVFLDIVRKIEDHPNSIGDMRQISTGIVQLFRQDGIVFDPSVATTANIVPYSPTGFPAYKNRLLLTKLIPDNQYKLPEEVIEAHEKCALHHMLSSSIYLHARGDEQWTCNYLFTRKGPSNKLKVYNRYQDVEIFDRKAAKDVSGRQIMGVGTCPLETGVVHTKWGEVAMGTVLAGIASGLEEQNVLVSDLVTVRHGFTDQTMIVNNRYASTLSGDIAETAIRQGTTRNNITIGASGGWNTTEAKRFYFVNRNTDLEMTDAEIRGGIDGLALSELGLAYAKQFPELKLSQLIDMYYSDGGVMHETKFRACNRVVLVPEIAAKQTLIDHTLGPAVALYHMSVLSATTDVRGIQNFVNNTVDALLSYIPRNMDDPVCNVTNDQILRPKINLILVMEPTAARSLQIAYIVNELKVGKFGSSITLVGYTGNVVVEQTFSMASFYQQLARNIVGSPANLDMVKVLQTIRALATKSVEEEHLAHYSGGNASVALFLADTIPLSGELRVRAVQEAELLRRVAPDLRLVFASNAASESTVSPMLQNPTDFISITLNSGGPPADILRSVTDYLKISPRRIVNPLCGVQWHNENPGTIGFEDYVDAAGINVYRLSPNYFYDTNLYRVIRIESTDLGPISVCYSWTNTFPRRNLTTSAVPDDVVCSSATTGGFVEIDLSTACASAPSIRECPFVYITVSATAVPATAQCKDFGCRYPNDVKYLVVSRELGCFNGVQGLQSSLNYLFIVVFFAVYCS